METEKTDWSPSIDSMADLHQRVSDCESVDVKLSRRITALEGRIRGGDDEFDPIHAMIVATVMVAIFQVVVPIVADWVVAWRASKEK